MPSKQGPRLFWRLSNAEHPKADIERTVGDHLLNHAVQVQLPINGPHHQREEDLEAFLFALVPPDEGYQVVRASLAEILFCVLNSNVLQQQGASLQALSLAERLESGNSAAITPDGFVHLSVSSDVHKRLGLTGQHSPSNPDRFNVSLDLRSKSLHPQAERHEQVLAKLKNALPQQAYLLRLEVEGQLRALELPEVALQPGYGAESWMPLQSERRLQPGLLLPPLSRRTFEDLGLVLPPPPPPPKQPQPGEGEGEEGGGAGQGGDGLGQRGQSGVADGQGGAAAGQEGRPVGQGQGGAVGAGAGGGECRGGAAPGGPDGELLAAHPMSAARAAREAAVAAVAAAEARETARRGTLGSDWRGVGDMEVDAAAPPVLLTDMASGPVRTGVNGRSTTVNAAAAAGAPRSTVHATVNGGTTAGAVPGGAVAGTSGRQAVRGRGRGGGEAVRYEDELEACGGLLPPDQEWLLHRTLVGLYDWLGGLACGMERQTLDLLLPDGVCPLHMSDLPPKGTDEEEQEAKEHMGALLSRTWRGMLSQGQVLGVVNGVRELVAADKAPWAAVHVWGFADAPVAWRGMEHGAAWDGGRESCYTLLLMPQGDYCLFKPLSSCEMRS